MAEMSNAEKAIRVARRKREAAKRKQNPFTAAFKKIFGTTKKIKDSGATTQRKR
jgi:hypothetical protein